MLVNTLGQRRYGHYFTNDIFKCIFFNENDGILTNISLKFILKGQINNISALVQMMAWHRLGDKPLSKPMMFSLLTHVCSTRPQWVKEGPDDRLLHLSEWNTMQKIHSDKGLSSLKWCHLAGIGIPIINLRQSNKWYGNPCIVWCC